MAIEGSESSELPIGKAKLKAKKQLQEELGNNADISEAQIKIRASQLLSAGVDCG